MNRVELLNALKMVIPGVSKGESILSGTDSFVFQGGMVKTYNEHLSVAFPLEIPGINGIAVKAVEMAKVLEKMTGMIIQIEVRDKSLFLTDGTTELSMQLLDIVIGDMLAELDLDNLDWDYLPPDFIKALTLCLPSVSRNLAHGAMTGLRFEGKEVISCDNIRASWYVFENLFEMVHNFTLPGGAAGELIKLSKLSMFCITNSWAHFMSEEGVVFSSRLIASEFPTEGIKNMFPKSIEGPAYHFPDQLQKAMERASIIPSFHDVNKVEFLTLEEKDGKLEVKGKRQFGSIKVNIPLKEGEWPTGLKIDIQPKYLSEIMKKINTFRMHGPIVYLAEETNNFRHIIITIIPPDEEVPESSQPGIDEDDIPS